MVRKAKVDDEFFREVMERLEEIPFDSDRKLMSTKYKLHGVPTVLTKGAVDVLLKRTDNIRDNEGIRPITDEDIRVLEEKNREFSENGLRVLAFSVTVKWHRMRRLRSKMKTAFTFVGLIAMIDPPREEAKAAVADAFRAGIRPVMISGTVAIRDWLTCRGPGAKQLGIFREGDIAVVGTELDAMTDKELDQLIVRRFLVFGRVSPENKIRIRGGMAEKRKSCFHDRETVSTTRPRLRKRISVLRWVLPEPRYRRMRLP